MIGAINFTVLNAAYICVLGDFCGYGKKERETIFSTINQFQRDNFNLWIYIFAQMDGLTAVWKLFRRAFKLHRQNE